MLEKLSIQAFYVVSLVLQLSDTCYPGVSSGKV